MTIDDCVHISPRVALSASTLMASYSGSQQSRTEHGLCNEDGSWSDILCEDVNHGTGELTGTCDSDDHELVLTVGQSRRYTSAVPDLTYSRHSPASMFDSRHDGDDDDGSQQNETERGILMDGNFSDIMCDDDDDDGRVHRHDAGRARQSYLSATLEARRLHRNNNTLTTDTDDACRPQLACPSYPGAYFHPQFNDDASLCLNDCESVAKRSHITCCSGNDLLPLDDDPQVSFLPLFCEFGEKLSCLDSGLQRELPPPPRPPWQRRERPAGNASQLGTWSEFSSSNESDDHLFHTTLAGRRHRHLSGPRRPERAGRWKEDWWARSCSEEPERSTADKLPVVHHSNSKRRQKKSSAEKMRKTSSLLADKAVSDVLSLPLHAAVAKKRGNRLEAWTSFADCLADDESNGTDSDSVQRLVDDGDDEDELACSFHCIPAENSEKQTSTCSASNSVCDKGNDCVSSEGELSASLADLRISDHDSFHSCPFRGILHCCLLLSNCLYACSFSRWQHRHYDHVLHLSVCTYCAPRQNKRTSFLLCASFYA